MCHPHTHGHVWGKKGNALQAAAEEPKEVATKNASETPCQVLSLASAIRVCK